MSVLKRVGTKDNQYSSTKTYILPYGKGLVYDFEKELLKILIDSKGRSLFSTLQFVSSTPSQPSFKKFAFF